MALTAKQRRELLERGHRVNLSLDQEKFRKPTGTRGLFSQPRKAATSALLKGVTVELPADGRPYDGPADGRPVGLPADRKPSLPADSVTVDPLLSDGVTVEDDTQARPEPIPLAPIQWAVFVALQQADKTNTLVTLKKLAQTANATVRGVRDALTVLGKVGAIVSRQTVRSADQQGLRIAVDHKKAFRAASLKETKGILMRGSVYRQTADRMPAALPSDGLRMYVCKKNTYIQEEDLKILLQAAPPGWQIREQTLVQIADLFPSMTALEFRLSLLRLIEQAQTGKQAVKNPNAWLKAAFEKNAAPLVTEREILARYEGRVEKPQPVPPPADDTAAIHLLYIEATDEERAAIDAEIERWLAPVLPTVATSHHADLRREARLEATQAYFGKKK